MASLLRILSPLSVPIAETRHGLAAARRLISATYALLGDRLLIQRFLE